MAEKCHVTGKVNTNEVLYLSGCDIEYGKWTDGPLTNVTATDGVKIFEAKGRDSTATGTEGWVEYSTGDGAKFRLYFDDPYSNQNQATITGVKGPFQMYTFNVTYPTSGREWEAVYTIRRK